jgi:hypothetical protein
LAYQPPVSSTFLLEQISHKQPDNSTFLSEQTSTSQPNRLSVAFFFYTVESMISRAQQAVRLKIPENSLRFVLGSEFARLNLY